MAPSTNWLPASDRAAGPSVGSSPRHARTRCCSRLSRRRGRSSERRAQNAAHLRDRFARTGPDGEGVREAVDIAGVAAQDRADPGLAELERVRLALVAQRVEAGG